MSTKREITHPHPIDAFKARVAGHQLQASNDPVAVQFEIGGKRYSLAQMLEANDVDAECCEWLRSAKPGDVFEQMHAERVQAVRE